MHTKIIAGLLAWSSVVAAVPSLVERTAGSCLNGNAPGSRNCWTNGYDLYTDNNLKFPDTGNTVMVSILDRQMAGTALIFYRLISSLTRRLYHQMALLEK
jgi:hypothetical protein